MEDIEDFLSETQRKINRLNDFIVLSLRRKQRSRELCVLTEKAIAVKDHMISAHRIMQEETNQLEEDYENVMTEMRRKQMLVMQFIIREKQRKIKEDQEEERKVQLVLSCTKNRPGSAVKTTTASATKSTMKLLGSHLAHLNLGGITPRLKISDYKDSPLAKKKIIPIPIQFAEFDVQITQTQFDKIPK